MRPTVIAVAVVEWDGQFLIGRRPAGVPLSGLWEFPGGKVEEGEAPEKAAIRECLEETGLAVEIVDEYSSHIEHYDHATVHLRFFRCRLCDPSQSPQAPFQWVPRDQLRRYEFPAGNRCLLKGLLDDT